MLSYFCANTYGILRFGLDFIRAGERGLLAWGALSTTQVAALAGTAAAVLCMALRRER